MSLKKWIEPSFNFPTSFNTWMDDVFGKDFRGQDFSGLMEKLGRMGTSVPAANIHETPEMYALELAAPGMQKDDFQIALKDQMLTISSEKKQENEEKEKNMIRREFSFSSFSRSFHLPEDIDAEKIAAQYENGVLQVSIPRKERKQADQGRKISVN